MNFVILKAILRLISLKVLNKHILYLRKCFALLNDIGVLHIIQDRLNFGKVIQSGDIVSFLVNAFNQIC